MLTFRLSLLHTLLDSRSDDFHLFKYAAKCYLWQWIVCIINEVRAQPKNVGRRRRVKAETTGGENVS